MSESTTPRRKAKTPRLASTYRAARRNAVLRGDVKGVWRGAPKQLPMFGYGHARLNRSRRWRYAKSYADARALSPFPNRAVR